MFALFGKIGTALKVAKWGAALVGLEYVRESANPEGGVVKQLVDGAINIGTPLAKEVGGQLVQGAHNLGIEGFDAAKEAVTSATPTVAPIVSATSQAVQQAPSAVAEGAGAVKEATQGFMEKLVGPKFAGIATMAIGALTGYTALNWLGGDKDDRNIVGKGLDKLTNAPGNLMSYLGGKAFGAVGGMVGFVALAGVLWAGATGRLGGMFEAVVDGVKSLFGYGKSEEATPEKTKASPAAPAAPAIEPAPNTGPSAEVPVPQLAANDEIRRASGGLANLSNPENANPVVPVAPTALTDIPQPSRNNSPAPALPA